MPVIVIFHERDPFALGRMGNNHGGFLLIYRGAANGNQNLLMVMPINLMDFPAKASEFNASVQRQRFEFELNKLMNKEISEEFVLDDIGSDDSDILFIDNRGGNYSG